MGFLLLCQNALCFWRVDNILSGGGSDIVRKGLLSLAHIFGSCHCWLVGDLSWVGQLVGTATVVSAVLVFFPRIFRNIPHVAFFCSAFLICVIIFALSEFWLAASVSICWSCSWSRFSLLVAIARRSCCLVLVRSFRVSDRVVGSGSVMLYEFLCVSSWE